MTSFTKKLTQMRTRSWVVAVEKRFEQVRAGTIARSVALYLEKQPGSNFTSKSGLFGKWQAGTANPTKTTRLQIDNVFKGTNRVWDHGPLESMLFDALTADYEQLWELSPLTRSQVTYAVSTQETRFSDRVRREFTGLTQMPLSPLQSLTNRIVLWRIVWMTLHSWQEVEQALCNELVATPTQKALADSGISIDSLKELLVELRARYSLGNAETYCPAFRPAVTS